MKSRLVLGVALLLLCFSACEENTRSQSLPHIPVPAAASAELQEAIRSRLWIDLTELPDMPTDTSGWLALIDGVKAIEDAGTAELLEQVDVSMERSEIAGVGVHVVTPTDPVGTQTDRLFLYMHGGAYVYGGGDGGAYEAILIASRIGIPVISVDYRMPPLHPFPAAIDDVTAVYTELLESYAAESIVIGGTSAGGGLALASVHHMQSLGIALPGALYAGTPWADLTKTGDTMYANERLDRIALTYDHLLAAAALLYANGEDLRNPLISPVYGDFSGFPPTILTTGTRDLFLSDVARAHRKLRESDVVAELHVFEGMSHAGYLSPPNSPESLSMYREVAAFIERFLK